MAAMVAGSPAGLGPRLPKSPNMSGKFLCTLCRTVMLRVFQLGCGHLVCNGCKNSLEAKNLVCCPDDSNCQAQAASHPAKDHYQECSYNTERFIKDEASSSMHHKKPHSLDKLPNDMVKITGNSTIVNCDNCSWKGLTNQELKTHLKFECKEALVSCPFIEVGCPHNQKQNREELEDHLKIGQELHLDLLLKDYVTLRVMANEFGKLFEIKKRWVSLEENYDRILSEIISMNSKTDARFYDLEEKVARIIDKEAKEKQSRCSSRSLDLLESRLNDMEAVLRCFQEDRLEGSQPGNFKGHFERIELKCNRQEQLHLKLEKQLDFLNARMDSLEHQVNGGDITSFDGVLLWKITDFTKKRHDAITKKATYILSPVFYSGQRGYKMCMRAYLNGDGVGKGTYMSVFFTIMKGPYDAVLPWPFKQAVRITVLDQNGGMNVEESFRPDPNSVSFQRPTRNVNIASGCPKFLLLASLESQRFVQDDCMFLKVTVDGFSL
eukprot:gene10463-19172_t